jgi:hypothetical protein
MRNIILLIVLIQLVSCGSNNDPGQSVSETSPVVLGVTANSQPKEWMKPGAECYGIVAYFKDEKFVEATTVKSQIIEISVRGIKCKALESVKVFGHYGCEKIGIKTNDIWYDLPNDLFQTREEALDFIENLKKEKS